METREELEAQKLRAEIVKLWGEAQSSEQTTRTDRRTAWATFALTLIAVGSAFLGLGDDLIDLVKKRTDLYRVEIDQKMIDLATQLGSGTAEERASAATLLSFYGEDAVPLLLTRLQSEPEASHRAIIESLRRIARAPGVKRDAVEELALVYATTTLDLRHYSEEEGSLDPMLNFINCLGSLIELRQGEAITQLKKLRKDIESRDSRVAEADRFILDRAIEYALEKLQAKT